ncbi:ComEA family DNA-binding protein [Streptomyces sp. NBC_00503]|uniref:ComEA family DNA-binding protein n=1 Tax=Streptomyces sp. NBC_00503 TaxID=2903659 RepID=UPI002E802A11|nr:ComEA family DNA-binding protein [Streptomyces sp. NBC_00503]WUD81293.1 ComEA family DNA-binding protein [Streptomyces sp. NBC_00503]
MTLRTRTSSPAGATSGPGRPRLSDGRLRHRRGDRSVHPEPAVVRRRAEALLGGHPPGAPFPHPPPEPVSAEGPAPAVTSAAAPPPVPAATPVPAAATASAVGSADGVEPRGGEGVLPDGVARRLAVRERLPVWLQTRCGMEPRAVAAVSVVLVAAVGFAGQQYWSARPQPVTAPALVAPSPTAAGSGRILVDVSGKVRDPGVRRLPAGSRVEDALVAAGGVRPGTDITGLNRARVLMDGEQVLVGAPAPPPTGGGAAPAPGPLSLGTATADQLDGLPGVGPVLAQHIVDFRTARGGFRSVEELRQVNGIGERRFADLRKLVRP